MCKQYNELLSHLELSTERCAQLLLIGNWPRCHRLKPFIGPIIQDDNKTLYLAISDTRCSFMRSWKWSKWPWGFDFPLYALILGSLNPSSNFASRSSLQKGDPVTSAINSSSCSSIATMECWRSFNRDMLYPLRNDLLLPSLGNEVLRTLLFSPPIQGIPYVCPATQSSEHVP